MAIFAPFSAFSLGEMHDRRRGCAPFAGRCNITAFPSKQAAMIQAETIAATDRDAAGRLSAAAERFGAVKDALGAVIFGQDDVIEQTLVTLLAGGHGLLIGVP